MQLHYIIDGYNLLHQIPPLKKTLNRDAAAAREQLIYSVSRLALRNKFRCTIVFDGEKPPFPHPEPAHAPVHVVFSAPESADAHIRTMIERSKKRISLVIISSDYEIVNFARVCSCATHTSKYFYSILLNNNNHDIGEEKDQSEVSKAEVDAWLKIFEKGNS